MIIFQNSIPVYLIFTNAVFPYSFMFLVNIRYDASQIVSLTRPIGLELTTKGRTCAVCRVAG